MKKKTQTALPPIPDPPRTITVRELRLALECFNDGAQVYLSQDAEGNAFSPIAFTKCIATGRYVGGKPWMRGEFEADEPGADPKQALAICLWPLL